MKILFLDIEKTPQLGAFYETFNTTIPRYMVTQRSFVPSISWAWNDNEVQNVNVTHDPKRYIDDHTDDYHVIKTIWDEVDKADVIVGHYVKGFDWKVLYGLSILHGLTPIEPKKCVDTLAEARKCKYDSNKLDELCKQFGFDRKIEHDQKMMLGCAQGDYESIIECAKYNDGDIPGMRKLYYLFRPYSHTTQYPNMRKITGKHCCDRCGSGHLQKRGLDRYGQSVYGCYDCRRRMIIKEKKHGLEMA